MPLNLFFFIGKSTRKNYGIVHKIVCYATHQVVWKFWSQPECRCSIQDLLEFLDGLKLVGKLRTGNHVVELYLYYLSFLQLNISLFIPLNLLTFKYLLLNLLY